MWYKFSTQQTPGHPTIFNLTFSTVIFFILAVAYLVGGGIMLTISLRQVQIKATYSDVEPLEPLTDEDRARVMQGQSALQLLAKPYVPLQSAVKLCSLSWICAGDCSATALGKARVMKIRHPAA